MEARLSCHHSLRVSELRVHDQECVDDFMMSFFETSWRRNCLFPVVFQFLAVYLEERLCLSFWLRLPLAVSFSSSISSPAAHTYTPVRAPAGLIMDQQ